MHNERFGAIILLDSSESGKHIGMAMPRVAVGSWGSALIPRVAVPAGCVEINGSITAQLCKSSASDS